MFKFAASFALRRMPCSKVGLIGALLFVSLPIAASVAEPERHALELEALQHPEQVLAALPELIAAAEQSSNQLELARLQLAHANACRVVADWPCQGKAAAAARIAASAARQPLLEVRALIAESRAAIAQQDYGRGELLLGEAEAQLQRTRSPELLADVHLAYSSMSHSLGKHARAQDYAERGLRALGNQAAPLIRARLLRNRGRAAAELGDRKTAHDALQEALRVAQAVQDPKLSAELDLELARLARIEGDISAQRASGERVLALARQFGNPQLRALGHEVLGIAAKAEGKLAEAESALRAADAGFVEAGLDAEQRRVLRDLIRTSLERNPTRADIGPQILRLMALDESLDQRDRALAGDDFEARLHYAEQDFKLKQLAKESEVAAARERALESSNRLRLLLIGIGALGLVVVAVFLAMQRRANARLSRAYAQLQQSETALEASEKRLRAVTDNIPALISHVDLNERYTFANAFMSRMFDAADHDIVGRSVREVRGEAIYATLAPHIETVMRGEQVSFEGSADFGGRHYHFQTSYIPDRDRAGNLQGFFAMTFDITRLKIAEQQLEREARFDALTGVANRRHFEERLALAIARGRRQPVALAVLYLDIDHLKQINDQHGHAVGDIVIREFATRLVACVRDGDLVARIGGDEFVVLSEHVEAVQAIDAAERAAIAVIAAMSAPVDAGAIELNVSTSIGVAATASVGSADALIAEADRALYAAKAAGRNTWRRGATADA